MTDGATIIRNAYKRAGIRGDAAISRETGFPYERFHKKRMKDTGSLTLHEFRLLLRHADFSAEEVLAIATEEDMREKMRLVNLTDNNKMEQTKKELESMATGSQDGMLERFAYISGRYTGEEFVPKELIDFALQMGKEVQLI